MSVKSGTSETRLGNHRFLDRMGDYISQVRESREVAQGVPERSRTFISGKNSKATSSARRPKRFPSDIEKIAANQHGRGIIQNLSAKQVEPKAGTQRPTPEQASGTGL
jgi:hypothetical protein